MRRLVAFACACAAMVLCATPASAQLVVDRMWVDLRTDGPGREDVLLRNEDDERYYVTLQAYEILNPGSAEEQRVEIADPEALGLLISPSRIILDPAASRAVRIVSIAEPSDRERIYRLRVNPQVSDIGERETQAQGEDRGINIRILMAYDILIVARPSAPSAVVERRPASEGVLLTNTGNSNTLLLNGEVCPRGVSWGGEGCETVGDYRLYAGQDWAITTTVADPVVRVVSRSAAGGQDRILEF